MSAAALLLSLTGTYGLLNTEPPRRWEWRNDEMTLAECQAECNRHDTCFGVEFESGLTVDNSPGLKDCIMIRRADTFVDCDSVHGANCDGWVIYGKPGAEPHGPGGDGNDKRWLVARVFKVHFMPLMHDRHSLVGVHTASLI